MVTQLIINWNWFRMPVPVVPVCDFAQQNVAGLDATSGLFEHDKPVDCL
jgi:hypothetical protein